jgi:tungstate transport system substrate-binding protein
VTLRPVGLGRGVFTRAFLLALTIASALLVLGPLDARAQQPPLVLGTTVGLQRTGLLDILLAGFERQAGRQVTVVAVSAPQALALGVRGELDALLVDGDEDEPPYMAAGHGIDRQLVLHADDVVVGPRNDPAQIQQAAGIDDALRRIAASSSTWVSRADNSGLFQLEKKLWREAGVEVVGQPWYVPLGQGMLPTLAASTERQAYALADRLTYLERRDSLDLAILHERSPDLLRLYHLIVINPAKGPWIDEAGARSLSGYLLGPDAQAVIHDFGFDRFGQAIFVPDAGRTEQELRPVRRPAA